MNGQLSSDWVSELGSSRDGWFDLGIESSSATEMCDEGSWGDCGATVDEENENKEEEQAYQSVGLNITSPES